MNDVDNFFTNGPRIPRKSVNFQQVLPKTYYFLDNEAYTEDHILVKKLYMFHVAPALSVKHLKEYFMTFGKVKHLDLHTNLQTSSGSGSKVSAEKLKTKCGVIVFDDAQCAAKALRRKVHYVKNARLSVVPSDSWHQPDVYDKDCNKPGSADGDEPLAAILNLNDHCLDHIFRLLPRPDRIHFARVCLRFREIYIQAAPALDKSITFEEFADLTMWDVRDFFMLSGSHVKEMVGVIPQRHIKRLAEYLGSNCINLTTLKISANKLPLNIMEKIFAKLDKLQILQLRGCDLRNDALLALKNLPELKVLDLSNNNRLTGQNMNRLPPTIESLTLTRCTSVQAKLLIKALKTLTQLKELHLKGIYAIGSAFKQLVESQRFHTLEAMTITNSSGFLMGNSYEYIAKLPSLKKVIVYSHDSDTLLSPELLSWLVEHKAEQLEHFETRGMNCLNGSMMAQIGKLIGLRTLAIPGNNIVGAREMEALCTLQQLEEINLKYCDNITDQSVLHLVLSCPKLRVLRLDNCRQLSEKLLSDIVFKIRLQIQQKETERPLPIKILLYGCNISQLSLKIEEMAGKDIISVPYEPPPTADLHFFDSAEMLIFDDEVCFGSDDIYDVFSDHDYEDNEDFDNDEDYEDYDGFDDGYDIVEMDISDVEDYWD
ncbi:F-box/LRR-repeat protein 7-like [Drosophila hydei]|uniref:F-box/LRR-repeat protein 7-like n=1 Tax=Drosophila hydei TaxID=7224 RepID=A0A6J1LAI9_DROHY|nr:F-box/LRR-repeat protein 7-like [Drosophila hydei]